MQKKAIAFILMLFFSFSGSPTLASGPSLANYPGTGENPHIYLNLAANGQKWQPFTIDYQQLGGIPCGSTGPFPNTPLATPAVYTGTQEPIVLSVQGPDIINNHGQHILLKGLVRPSLEWNPQGQFLSPQDIQNMAKWKANVIRLDLNQNYWFDSKPVTEKGSYKQIINAIIYYAIQNNMAVILDLHWTTNGGQSPMANKESIKFWQEVAQDYKNFGTVIFELFNEPEGIDPATWLNGNEQYAGYQELYQTIRDTGANNICIVNGLDYGYDLSFINENFYVQGTNIVYGSHPYNEKGSINYQGPGGNFDHNFKGILGKYPLIFTEFGVNDNSYFPDRFKDVYQRILTYANQHHINYTAFAWWVDATNPNTFPDVIADWSGTPLNGGVMIQQDMQTYFASH